MIKETKDKDESCNENRLNTTNVREHINDIIPDSADSIKVHIHLKTQYLYQVFPIPMVKELRWLPLKFEDTGVFQLSQLV